jgi:hypothetical protein
MAGSSHACAVDAFAAFVDGRRGRPACKQGDQQPRSAISSLACTYGGVDHVDRLHLVDRALVRDPVDWLAPTELVDEHLKLPAVCAPEVLAVRSCPARALVVLLVRYVTRRLVLDRDVVVQLRVGSTMRVSCSMEVATDVRHHEVVVCHRRELSLHLDRRKLPQARDQEAWYIQRELGSKTGDGMHQPTLARRMSA